MRQPFGGVVAVLGFQMLLGCGSTDSVDEKAAGTPAPATTPSETAPPAADPPAAAAIPIAPPTAQFRTDLNDPIAAAICAERAKAPRGSVMADESWGFGFDGFDGVTALVAPPVASSDKPGMMRSYVSLLLESKGTIASDLQHGVTRRQGYFYFDIAVDTAPDKAGFVVGVYPSTYTSTADGTKSCSQDGDEKGGAVARPGPSAKLTITSHTDTLLEGEIESPSWDVGGVSRIKFSAPLRKTIAESNAQPNVCCLK